MVRFRFGNIRLVFANPSKLLATHMLEKLERIDFVNSVTAVVFGMALRLLRDCTGNEAVSQLSHDDFAVPGGQQF